MSKLILKRFSVYYLIGSGGYLIALAHGRWWGWIGVPMGLIGYLILAEATDED